MQPMIISSGGCAALQRPVATRLTTLPHHHENELEMSARRFANLQRGFVSVRLLSRQRRRRSLVFGLQCIAKQMGPGLFDAFYEPQPALSR